MWVIMEATNEPTKRPFAGSYPSVITDSDSPPPGISPTPSHITHRPPSDLTVSVAFHFVGGWSGPIKASPSHVHSPTILCSHACSFCGSGLPAHPSGVVVVGCVASVT